MGQHSAPEVEFIDGEPTTLSNLEILPVGKAEVDFQRPTLEIAAVDITPVDPFAEADDEDLEEDDGEQDFAADLDQTDYDLP